MTPTKIYAIQKPLLRPLFATVAVLSDASRAGRKSLKRSSQTTVDKALNIEEMELKENTDRITHQTSIIHAEAQIISKHYS